MRVVDEVPLLFQEVPVEGSCGAVARVVDLWGQFVRKASSIHRSLKYRT